MKQLMLRQALNKINNIARHKINKIECKRVSISLQKKPVFFQKNHYDRLKSDSALNTDIINRSKNCQGDPMFRVSDVDKSADGLRAKQRCIACKKLTNWCCVLCINWACHNKSEATVKHIFDVNVDSMGHWITAVKSCFIECQPNYLRFYSRDHVLIVLTSTLRACCFGI